MSKINTKINFYISYRANLKLARVSWIRDVSVAADVLIAAISVDANVLDTHSAVIYR